MHSRQPSTGACPADYPLVNVTANTQGVEDVHPPLFARAQVHEIATGLEVTAYFLPESPPAAVGGKNQLKTATSLGDDNQADFSKRIFRCRSQNE
jgi:hypothetical protein